MIPENTPLPADVWVLTKSLRVNKIRLVRFNALYGYWWDEAGHYRYPDELFATPKDALVVAEERLAVTARRVKSIQVFHRRRVNAVAKLRAEVA